MQLTYQPLSKEQITYVKTHLPSKTIIRIFGYSGVGKGTLATQLSNTLQIPNLDTGKFWRAITVWYLSQNQPPVWNEQTIRQAFAEVDISISGLELTARIDSHVLSFDELRNPKVNAMVANLSSDPFARRLFYGGIYQAIKPYTQPIISDGRGAVVPYLEQLEVDGWKIIKLMVNADVKIAAQRRTKEMIQILSQEDATYLTDQTKQETVYQETLASLKKRNEADEESWRKNNITTITHDTVIIDSSALTIPEVLETALGYLHDYCI